MMKISQRVAFRYLTAKIRTVTLPKGSVIFHGTCERLSGRLRPGGYDDVAWFADSPAIAQLYTCRSGGESIFSIKHLMDGKSNLYKQIVDYLGIKPDPHPEHWEVPWKIPTPKGWSPNPEIALTKEDIHRQQIRMELQEEDLEEKLEEMKRGNLEPHELNKYEFRVISLKDQIEKRKKKIQELTWSIGYHEEYDMYRKVDMLMEQAGFKRIGTPSKGLPQNNGFSALSDGGKFLPPGQHIMGTLIVAKTKRDMTLWNKATGEGNLMNVQYHDIQGFRNAEEFGLDGVFIDDFAQSEAYGNLGHLSVGLFDHALNDLQYKFIKAPYREYENHDKTPEWSGPISNFRRLK